jgi:ParB-like chromosome segregation protein Spo0J
MTKINWTLVTWKIKDLIPHPQNPRKLTSDQYRHLKQSMDKFGYIDKIIINQNGSIIGGHQRYQILKKDKVKEVECWVPDVLLDDNEINELMVRLNRNHGEWDYDILANSFNVPDLLEYGFTADELHFDVEGIAADESEDKPKKEKSCPHCGGAL